MIITPDQYTLITRSIRLNDYVTSVRLEKKFWEVLELLARSQGLSTPRYISRLYDEMLVINGIQVKHGKAAGLASLIRLVCTNWLVQMGDKSLQLTVSDK